MGHPLKQNIFGVPLTLAFIAADQEASAGEAAHFTVPPTLAKQHSC